MLRVVMLAVVVGVLLPAGAHAVIVPGVGMAGVKLEMDKGQVRAKLGDPTSRIRNGTALYWEYGPTNRSLRVQFDSRGVYGFYLTNRSQKTKEGVGVGSSRAAVDRISGTRCRKTYCQIGRTSSGRSYTLFSLDAGKVFGITIALSSSAVR